MLKHHNLCHILCDKTLIEFSAIRLSTFGWLESVLEQLEKMHNSATPRSLRSKICRSKKGVSHSLSRASHCFLRLKYMSHMSMFVSG